MNTSQISKGDPAYPLHVEDYLDNNAPPTITALGNLDLLRNQKLAFFCSVKCPGGIILQAYDLALALRRQERFAIAGGFHTPMEKECLALLLRGRARVVVCPARGIQQMRVPAAWREPISEGRLLVLSPFTEKQGRSTAESAQHRNNFVAALCERAFTAYAAPGGKTEQLCRQIVAWRKPLYTFEAEANNNLIAMGATPIRSAENIG